MPMPREAITTAAALATCCSSRVMKRARGSRGSARVSYMSVDGDGAAALAVDGGAVHAFAVEGHDDVTAMVHGDETAVALQSCKLSHHCTRRLRQRLVAIAQARRAAASAHAAAEGFAPPRARDGGSGVG